MKTKERVKAIKKIVAPMIKEGKTLPELVTAVNSAGIKNKLGNQYKQDALLFLIKTHKLGRPSGMKAYTKRTTKVLIESNQSKGEAEALRSLILHAKLSADLKIKLLKTIEGK